MQEGIRIHSTQQAVNHGVMPEQQIFDTLSEAQPLASHHLAFLVYKDLGFGLPLLVQTINRSLCFAQPFDFSDKLHRTMYHDVPDNTILYQASLICGLLSKRKNTNKQILRARIPQMLGPKTLCVNVLRQKWHILKFSDKIWLSWRVQQLQYTKAPVLQRLQRPCLSPGAQHFLPR